MYKIPLAALVTALLLNACVLVPAENGYGLAVAPALPAIVELGLQPYYYQRGYYYYYDNSRWRYAQSRAGPWSDLPRDRYPREIRFRGRDDRRDHDDRR